MLHSHTGWETFSREYGMLHKLKPAQVDSLRRVLAKCWLGWSLVSWCDEMLAPLGPVDLSSEQAVHQYPAPRQPS